MFGWIRNYFRLRLLGRALRTVAEQEWRADRMEMPEYAKVVTASYNPKAMKTLMVEMKTADGLLGGPSDWDWEAILKWIEEFFIPLVKMLLPLILLLDEE